MIRRLLGALAVACVAVSLTAGGANASEAPFGPTDSCDSLTENMFAWYACNEFVFYGWWTVWQEHAQDTNVLFSPTRSR